MIKQLLISTLFFLKFAQSSFIFDWLGWSDQKGTNLSYKGVPLIQIPFEELSPEDKFLVEASKIVGFELTELDACQHRLVMKLKSSCGSLSEEDLAKFSVNLLNCHSAVEGRKEFPCQEKMSLKECTSSMDAETWNAYHVMNNRARAVCYASRQQQFRALAEMTVNKLMSTAHSHIEVLTSLQKESDSLKGGTSITLGEIEKSQRDVLNRQRSLASISLVIGEEIQQALVAVNDQKQILNDYKKDMAKLINKLQTKLDNAEKQLTSMTGSVKSSHTDLMNDMNDISNAATQILNKMDDSSKTVLRNNDATLQQFKEALSNMKEINLSIGYILSIVETIKDRSSVISDIMGEKGERLEMIILLIVHSLCLIIAMVIVSFLSSPWTSRIALLICSSLNTYTSVAMLSDINLNYPKVSLIQFYCGFAVIAVCDWLIRLILRIVINKKSDFKALNDLNTSINRTLREATPNNHLDDSRFSNNVHGRSHLLNKINSNFDQTPVSNKVNNWLSENRYRNTENSGLKSSNLNGHLKDSNIDDDAHSHISSLARSISGRSGGGRSICTAISKHTGQRCRKKATNSSTYCSIHER